MTGVSTVLLIERGSDPFRGCYALPGGFVDYGEDIEEAIDREIAEETGLTGLPFRQFRTFGSPGRDPAGPYGFGGIRGGYPRRCAPGRRR